MLQTTKLRRGEGGWWKLGQGVRVLANCLNSTKVPFRGFRGDKLPLLSKRMESYVSIKLQLTKLRRGEGGLGELGQGIGGVLFNQWEKSLPDKNYGTNCTQNFFRNLRI